MSAQLTPGIARDQSDSDNAICPYCGNKHYMEAEDYNTSGTEMECGNCGMNFHYATRFSVYHVTAGDCSLNGLEHQWRNYNGSTQICDRCDKFSMKEEPK